MTKFRLQDLIDSLPAGPERTILSVLRFHQGKDHSILGEDLNKALAMHGLHINERLMRDKIVEMRLQGVLIGALPGSDGGYYICTSREEFEEFIYQEYIAKMRSMSKVTRALIRSANDRWGKRPRVIANQPSLF